MKNCILIQDKDINSLALWILSFLTDTGDSKLSKLLDLLGWKTIKAILDYTLCSKTSMKLPALRIICNFLSGDNNAINVYYLLISIIFLNCL